MATIKGSPMVDPKPNKNDKIAYKGGSPDFDESTGKARPGSDLERRIGNQPNPVEQIAKTKPVPTPVVKPTPKPIAKPTPNLIGSKPVPKPTPTKGKPNVGIGLPGRNPGMKMPLQRSGAGLLGKAAAFVDKIYKTY
jgi:hypothetical protein